jgi:hypothetical protein
MGSVPQRLSTFAKKDEEIDIDEVADKELA